MTTSNSSAPHSSGAGPTSPSGPIYVPFGGWAPPFVEDEPRFTHDTQYFPFVPSYLRPDVPILPEDFLAEMGSAWRLEQFVTGYIAESHNFWGYYVFTSVYGNTSYSDIFPIKSKSTSKEVAPTMLEKLLKLYSMYMATGVTSPMPHFVGPPGSGKSTVFQQLADLLGVKLHVINVSRISPLALEGLEMPDRDNERLRLLLSQMWTQAEEGDIYLFDEFLRGFPEVYNGLLDIFTSREVAGYKLPRVFIAGASNSVVTYDGALEDRLLHIPVADPRKNKAENTRLMKLLVEQLGLLPEMVESWDMQTLMEKEVHPTFELLDQFTKKGIRGRGTQIEGTSLRKLIGQAKLREVHSTHLRQLIEANNQKAMYLGKPQYVLLLNGKNVLRGYESQARELLGNPQLTPLQAQNLELNLQLIQMEKIKQDNTMEEEENDDDD